MENYFFDLKIKKKIFIHGKVFEVGAMLPSYKKELYEGFFHLSSDSIRNRFHGIKKEFSDQELNYLTSLDGVNHYAIGLRNEFHQGVAVARFIRNHPTSMEAEVAITIIDQFQKLGLGSFLFKCIAYAAFERGIQTLIINLLDHNEGMMKLVAKFGRVTRRVRYLDTLTLYMELNEGEMKQIKEEISSWPSISS